MTLKSDIRMQKQRLRDQRKQRERQIEQQYKEDFKKIKPVLHKVKEYLQDSSPVLIEDEPGIIFTHNEKEYRVFFEVERLDTKVKVRIYRDSSPERLMSCDCTNFQEEISRYFALMVE